MDVYEKRGQQRDVLIERLGFIGTRSPQERWIGGKEDYPRCLYALSTYDPPLRAYTRGARRNILVYARVQDQQLRSCTLAISNRFDFQLEARGRSQQGKVCSPPQNRPFTRKGRISIGATSPTHPSPSPRRSRC